METLVLVLATRDDLATTVFSGLIAQYGQLSQEELVIYIPDQEHKSLLEKM
jgi:hypothetical protein